MKLNGGKGWEAMKAHPSAAHLHHASALPNTSTAEIHGGRVRQTKPAITGDRLNADLPVPKPGASRQPPGASAGRQGARMDPKYPTEGKRKSMGDMVPPEGSTMAQFQNSRQNLPQGMSQQSPVSGNQQHQSTAVRGQQNEPKEGVMKKIMKVLCCGMYRLVRPTNGIMADPLSQRNMKPKRKLPLGIFSILWQNLFIPFS